MFTIVKEIFPFRLCSFVAFVCKEKTKRKAFLDTIRYITYINFSNLLQNALIRELGRNKG